ncbi:hypothetical protein CEXT_317971 [Caerostris extrusa]|uniref:Uncharacterized protein n=1 Tax=Caerostris extrusa TaxID=172846 RepID=A0AAV4Q1J5_CAEEX|nr:hypothetical protein CEXT_317971 [Caerostris extrusa]
MRYCDPDTMAPDIGEYKQLSRLPTRDAASNARLIPTIDLYICQIQDTSKILLGVRVFIYARAEKISFVGECVFEIDFLHKKILASDL